jgi:predicted aldo/keto reductase-like oxidoreductase
MYCGHRAPYLKKIDIALVNKYLDLALIQEYVLETLKNHYGLLEHHANECIECELCIKNCPFGLDIINKIKQAIKVFDK